MYNFEIYYSGSTAMIRIQLAPHRRSEANKSFVSEFQHMTSKVDRIIIQYDKYKWPIDFQVRLEETT